MAAHQVHFLFSIGVIPEFARMNTTLRTELPPRRGRSTDPDHRTSFTSRSTF